MRNKPFWHSICVTQKIERTFPLRKKKYTLLSGRLSKILSHKWVNRGDAVAGNKDLTI